MLNPIKNIIGDFKQQKEPIYYTSLFQSCGIGEYYLKNLGLIGAISNEILPQRAKWSQEIYPECDVVCGDIWDTQVFEKLVELHSAPFYMICPQI